MRKLGDLHFPMKFQFSFKKWKIALKNQVIHVHNFSSVSRAHIVCNV